MRLYEKLRVRRAELGMTLEDVAKEVGVNPATIYRWENGKVGNIKSNKIISLAKVLKISPAYIISKDDKEDLKIKELEFLNALFEDYNVKSFDEFIKTVDNEYDCQSAIVLSKNKKRNEIDIVSIPSDVYTKMIKLLKVIAEF